MRDREWFTGSGELDWWSSSDGAGAPDVGVERECFFSSLNICGASSLPLPVLLNLSTCTTEPKLLTQHTLSNSIPSSRWLCVCDRVFGLQRKYALWASLSSFSSHFWLMKENVGVLLLVEVQILCGPLWTLGKFQGSTNLYFEGVYRLNYC